MATRPPPPLPIAGVIGWPIGHSLSPMLHGWWLARHGLKGAYLPFAVPPETLPAAIQGLRALGFRGANLTLPHKEAAVPLCDRLTPRAAAIGSVNTLVVEPDGALLGDSSDGIGWLASLAARHPDVSLAGREAALLGAGGATRAIIAALSEAKVARLHLLARNPAQAEAVAPLFTSGPITIAPMPTRAPPVDLLINTTPLGMQGHPPLTLDLGALPPTALVADLIYRPRQTPLLAAATARGLKTLDGLGMLLHQAVVGFEAWFGLRPAVEPALEAHLLAALEHNPGDGSRPGDQARATLTEASPSACRSSA